MNKILNKIKKNSLSIIVIYIIFNTSYLMLHSMHINFIDLVPNKNIKFNLYYTYENHGSGYYLYTDKGEFINRDSFFNMKYNSRRIHNYLLTKFKFNFSNYNANILQCSAVISGYRIYFPSSYPNILSISCD
jgi:hypothetical protein